MRLLHHPQIYSSSSSSSSRAPRSPLLPQPPLQPFLRLDAPPLLFQQQPLLQQQPSLQQPSWQPLLQRAPLQLSFQLPLSLPCLQRPSSLRPPHRQSRLKRKERWGKESVIVRDDEKRTSKMYSSQLYIPSFFLLDFLAGLASSSSESSTGRGTIE